MIRIVLTILFTLSLASPVFSQTENESDPRKNEAFQNFLGLRICKFCIVANACNNPETTLELLDYQKDALKPVFDEYEQLNQDLRQVYEEGGDAADKQAAMNSIVAKMELCDKQMTSDILLPHQTAELSSKAFAQMVDYKGGDLISTLQSFYPVQFELNNTQQTRMKEIKESAARKIAKAKRELQERLKEISTEVENEIRTVLTPNQSKLLSELAGRQ
jgi:hypothetical protein